MLDLMPLLIQLKNQGSLRNLGKLAYMCWIIRWSLLGEHRMRREAEFSISLWGKAKQQIRELKLWEKDSTQIVIITSLATKQFDEIHGASMSPTKIYVNLDIPEVKQYLDRFGSFNIQPQLLTRKFELVEETSETMPSIRKTISDLIQTSVLEVESRIRVCNTPQSESMIWYHLKTIVQDETDSTTFIIFGTKVGRQPICWEGQSKLVEPLKKDEITPLLEKLQSDYLEQIPCHAPKPNFKTRQTSCTRETGPTNAQGSELIISHSDTTKI
ncbi:hypothetical protein SLE2022_317540 [Rubroshorea leprosula]